MLPRCFQTMSAGTSALLARNGNSSRCSPSPASSSRSTNSGNADTAAIEPSDT
jgi:hypothetical protein